MMDVKKILANLLNWFQLSKILSSKVLLTNSLMWSKFSVRFHKHGQSLFINLQQANFVIEWSSYQENMWLNWRKPMITCHVRLARAPVRVYAVILIYISYRSISRGWTMLIYLSCKPGPPPWNGAYWLEKNGLGYNTSLFTNLFH